jgi:hypothetical protein
VGDPARVLPPLAQRERDVDDAAAAAAIEADGFCQAADAGSGANAANVSAAIPDPPLCQLTTIESLYRI